MLEAFPNCAAMRAAAVLLCNLKLRNIPTTYTAWRIYLDMD